MWKGAYHSAALRIKRICSNESTAPQRCDELVSHLTRRGYNKNKVKKEGSCSTDKLANDAAIIIVFDR